MQQSTNPHPLVGLARPLRQTLAAGAVARGIFVQSGDTAIAEICGLVGFDWAVLDMEASPMSKRDAFQCAQALSHSRCSVVVRVPYLNRHNIEHALDIGAHGVLVPRVDTPEMAMVAAAACRYPPEGDRGVNPIRASAYFGNITNYLREANAAITCVVQIESAEAVKCVDEIAAVPGVDALFLGMGDLASSYGQAGDVTGPAMDHAREAVLTAARRYGKHAGIFAFDADLAKQYLREGFKLLALGNDLKMFRQAAVDLLQQVPPVDSTP